MKNSSTKRNIALYPDTIELLRNITKEFNLTDDQAIKWLIESRNQKRFDKILKIINEVLI